MSRTAFLSLMGMYNLVPTLFDGMNYPDSWTAEDKEHFKYELLTETAELEVIYNNGDVMRSMIAHWSYHKKPIWEHMIETTQYEYDPIANWDKRETIVDTRNLTLGHSRNTSHSTTTGISHTTIDDHTTQATNEAKNSGVDTVGVVSTGTESGTNTHKVNGLGNNANDNSMAVKTQDETSGTTGGNSTTTTTHGHNILTTDRSNTSGTTELSGTDTVSGSGTDSGTDTDSGTIRREYTGKGNIGTMTSQDMINQERAIARFDIMEYIINDFKNRFLILIY